MAQRSAGVVEVATAERSAERLRIIQHTAAQGDAGDTAQRRTVQATHRSTVQCSAAKSRAWRCYG
jgi:hypothetical protein